MTDKTETLKSQYAQAVMLYRHEDTTNWQKLQHAVYVNAGLATVVGLDAIQSTKWVVACVAAAIGLLFFVSLENGRRHMMARLEAVQSVEKEMSAHGGIHPLLNDVSTPAWLPRTTTAMSVFLCLMIVAWAILAIFWGVTG
jgi:hypothetical protein